MSGAPTKKVFKIGVVAIIFKKTPNGILVMTQLRKVRNPDYDSLYNDTWELMGELANPEESVLDTIIRGCSEEFGIPDFKPIRIIGAYPEAWTTGRGDAVQCHQPLCYIHSLGEPQPWIDPVFAVQVPKNFEPDYEKGDKEATRCKWWKPEDLIVAVVKSPLEFMGFHRPALRLFCHHVLTGKIS